MREAKDVPDLELNFISSKVQSLSEDGYLPTWGAFQMLYGITWDKFDECS